MLGNPPQGQVNSSSLKVFGHRFVRALGTRLAAKTESACIVVQGDSTGVSTIRWVYLVSQWLAAKFPTYTTTYRTWNDTNQNYDAPTVLQTGSSGDAYATLPGVAGSYISAPDKSALTITGDIDIMAKAAADNWKTGAAQTIVSKFGNAGQRGWALAVDGSGKPYLWWSSDGTANTVVSATTAITTPNGQAVWIRATMDVDNGAAGNTVTFYTSSDGVTWTQLGSPVVTTGIASLFASTSPIEIGSRTGGGTELFIGKIYEIIVENGISGKPVLSPNLDFVFPSGTTTFKDAEANTWTVNGTTTVGNGSPGLLILNSSKSGAAIAYSTDVTRFALQTPIEPQLAFINYSHNEGTNISYQSTYEGLASQLTTAFPNVGVVCIVQNPQKTPELNIKQHAIRCRQISAAAAKNDYGMVDIHRAFTEVGDYSGLYIDGVHPNPAGSNLWSGEVIKFLQPAVL